TPGGPHPGAGGGAHPPRRAGAGRGAGPPHWGGVGRVVHTHPHINAHKRAPDTGPAGMARSLRAAAGEDTAVVAWTGYTTPVGVGLDAASGRLAEAGADRLVRFTAGLDAIGAPDPVLFCHSYGSVVGGLAAGRTDAVDIVVFGSPGMRAATAADLHTRARVWAARGPSDWIGDVPNVEFAGIGHGADPTSAAFGARKVPAADVHGHTGYLVPGTQSLAAFAAIAKGEVR
ncbi:alpha/beta hydrolase, partial [Streptomyces vinaceus]|uniref:alpha/beta hydrolase n=1 Tax=Streptomyces vinaceus TaxID=1960 RepID=UPI003685B59A